MTEEKKKVSPALVIIPVALGLAVVGVVAALALAKPPEEELPPEEPAPGKANLYGKVTNAQTGAAISGVLVSLDGVQAYTDSAGNYLFGDLQPKSYVIQFSKEGFQMTSQDIVLKEGNNQLNIAMVPIIVPPVVANLYGKVTDASTGLAISGVKATIDSLTTYTDASGNYGFTGLGIGSYVVKFEKSGYYTVTG